MAILVLALSAAGLVKIATDEGYTAKAVPDPVKGTAVPTLGFGTTGGVKMGDTTTPVKALQRKLADVQKLEGAIKRCVKVSLHQYEYDAYVNFSYNVGATAFCGSRMVQLLNAGQYEAACNEFPRWKFVGTTDCSLPQNAKTCGGIVARRERSRLQCLGKEVQ